MRILQVVSTPPYARHGGGTARVPLELSEELVSRGHEVTLVTADVDEPARDAQTHAGGESVDRVHIIRFKAVSNRMAVQYKVYLSPGLIRYVAKTANDFDLIHLHDLISLHAVAVQRYAKAKRVPYVLTPHGSIPRMKDLSTPAGVFGLLFGRGVLRNASMITALSQHEANQCLGFGISPKHVTLVPNGIRAADYAHIPSGDAFRKSLGIDAGESVVLYLGRLNRSKRLTLLLEAYARVARNVRATRLVFVGPDEGEERHLAERAQSLGLRDNVRFAGFVEEGVRLAALATSTVLVIPTFTGFPVTFLEALAVGTPVITSDASDRLEWLDGVAGIVAASNPAGLARAIQELLLDERLRARYREKGKALVRESFSWSKIASIVEGVYEVCMEAR